MIITAEDMLHMVVTVTVTLFLHSKVTPVLPAAVTPFLLAAVTPLG